MLPNMLLLKENFCYFCETQNIELIKKINIYKSNHIHIPILVMAVEKFNYQNKLKTIKNCTYNRINIINFSIF